MVLKSGPRLLTSLTKSDHTRLPPNVMTHSLSLHSPCPRAHRVPALTVSPRSPCPRALTLSPRAHPVPALAVSLRSPCPRAHHPHTLTVSPCSSSLCSPCPRAHRVPTRSLCPRTHRVTPRSPCPRALAVSPRAHRSHTLCPRAHHYVCHHTLSHCAHCVHVLVTKHSSSLRSSPCAHHHCAQSPRVHRHSSSPRAYCP